MAELTRWRTLWLGLGPAAFLGCLLGPPGGLPPNAVAVLGIALWMAVWWISECVPLAATSLLPIVLFPVLGIASAREAASHFANEVIFLFMGGFFLAAALEGWNAHTRIALGVVTRVGRSSRMVVLGTIVATGLVSMWVNNTSTTAMMYPIALAIGGLFGSDATARGIRMSLLLGVAYAATLGGMATLVGTAPNIILAGAARELLGREVSFFSFLAIGVPISLTLLAVCWALLCFGMYRERRDLTDDAFAALVRQRASLPRLGGGELAVLLVFAATALAWVFREPKDLGWGVVPGITQVVPGVTDAVISISGALLLFVLPGRSPAGAWRPLLTWRQARGISWDALLLFGGGLSLASAMDGSGLAGAISGWLSGWGGAPTVVLYLGLAAVILLLSEIASNTAIASMMMPLAVSIAAPLGQDPLQVMILSALAASLGFALPMATPPNAIVFGSGELTVREMVKAGVWLDLAGVVVVALAVGVRG